MAVNSFQLFFWLRRTHGECVILWASWQRANRATAWKLINSQGNEVPSPRGNSFKTTKRGFYNQKKKKEEKHQMLNPIVPSSRSQSKVPKIPFKCYRLDWINQTWGTKTLQAKHSHSLTALQLGCKSVLIDIYQSARVGKHSRVCVVSPAKFPRFSPTLSGQELLRREWPKKL